MSTFDPEAFLHTVFTESSITQVPPPPEGEYIGTIRPGSLQLRFVGEDNIPLLEMVFNVAGEEVQRTTGQPQVGVRYTCWLEKGPNGVDIKNSVRLGRLREAIGLNTEGQPWSFSQFEGRQARVQVVHETGADGEVYAKIRRVTKI